MSGVHTKQGPGNRAGLMGLGVLIFMLLACLTTLPFTLAKDASGEPRYNAGELAWARVAPWWAGGARERSTPDTGKAPLAQGGAGAAPHPWFWLGSDTLGRSELIRCLAGGGVSLVVGLAAAGVSVVIGTVYGAIAGFAGGRLDSVMMRLVDVLYGLPYVLLVVLLAVATDSVVSEAISRQRERQRWVEHAATRELLDHGRLAGRDEVREALRTDAAMRERLERAGLDAKPPRQISSGARQAIDLGTLLVAIAGVSWLSMARVIRGQVMSLKAREFVLAARAIGLSPWRVLVRHIAPNLWGTVLVYGALTVPQAMLQEAFLSFLGIGVKPPMPSWGSLAAAGLAEINPVDSSWWLIVFPCVLLAATLLSLNLVGEWLRRRLEPRSVRA
ncbi:MAG: ABC transporter permease subunit [Tepidisphaera sp.]|nr:ABC transporter permease subunit [Tepidisphaera sp.]